MHYAPILRLTLLTGLWLAQPLLAGASTGNDSGPAGPGIAAWFGLVVLSLIVVLVAALLWVSRQRLRGSDNQSGIDILGIRPLGPREYLVVVRIEDRILVIGHTPSQINLVTELDSYSPATAASAPSTGFAQQLKRWIEGRPA